MSTTPEDRMATAISELLEADALECNNTVAGRELRSVSSFVDAGVMTMNSGVVVRFEDGSEFQVTVVQSRLSESDTPACGDCESYNTEWITDGDVKLLHCNDCDAEFDEDEIDED